MISPVAQRQIFQTAHVEATRQAHEVADQLQREMASRQAADDRLTEGMVEVHEISHAEQIRTEERKERRRQQHAANHEGPEVDEEEPGEAPEKAGPAGPHLDLLA